MLHDVAMRAENGAHGHVHLVLRRDVQLKLELADLTQNLLNIDVSGLCLLVNDDFELLTGIH